MDLTPATPEEVAEAVGRLRAEDRTAVVVGGGTLIDVADPGPADAELWTTGLGGVVAHEPADLTFTCGAGMTLAEARRVLEGDGQTLPLWHPAPERATLGGLVAFGWTGLGRRLYGLLRDRVLEVRVVTGEGKVVRGGGKVVKNVTGFDLPRLFCGSMGTLGVVYELTLKVQPRPGPLFGVRRDGDDPATLAGELVRAVGGTRMPTEALLVRDAQGWSVRMFAPGPREDAEKLLAHLEDGGPLDEGTFDALATDRVLCPGAAPETWEPQDVVVRWAVPPARVVEAAALLGPVDRGIVDVASGVGWTAFGSTEPVLRLREFCEGAGGSAVLLRAPDEVRRELGTWGRRPATLELMQRLKNLFDPDGVLGPGRFVI